MHHIAGEHEWVDGECEHGPLVATEVGKTYLDKNSRSFEEIQKVVLDQKFLKSFHYYVSFRYVQVIAQIRLIFTPSIPLKYALTIVMIKLEC